MFDEATKTECGKWVVCGRSVLGVIGEEEEKILKNWPAKKS